MTASAVVWSGNLLKIIPYADAALSANGASWNPDLTWQYTLGDGDSCVGKRAAKAAAIQCCSPAPTRRR